jgi:hypothetical protein
VLVAGTLYFGHFCRSVPPLAGATAQFLSAAVVASLCAWSLETPYAEWTDSAIAAVAWNTFMVSLGGMALYFAMLFVAQSPVPARISIPSPARQRCSLGYFSVSDRACLLWRD